jgi:hypothetical protein
MKWLLQDVAEEEGACRWNKPHLNVKVTCTVLCQSISGGCNSGQRFNSLQSVESASVIQGTVYKMEECYCYEETWRLFHLPLQTNCRNPSELPDS